MLRNGHEANFHELQQYKGNADTERVFRTLKDELIWRHSPQELARELESRIEGYNDSCLHSALGYRPPNAGKHHIM